MVVIRENESIDSVKEVNLILAIEVMLLDAHGAYRNSEVVIFKEKA